MTKEELIKIVKSNTEVSWQTTHIIEAIEEHDKQIRAEVVDKYTNKPEELIRYGIFVTRNELLEDILAIATEIKEQNK